MTPPSFLGIRRRWFFSPTILWGGLILSVLGWMFWAISGPVQWLDSGTYLVEAAHLPLLVTNQTPTFHPFYHMLTVIMHRLIGPAGVTHLNWALSIPLVAVIIGLSRAIGLNQPGTYVAVVAVLLVNNLFWVATKVEVYTLHLLLILSIYWIACLPLTPWRRFGLGLLGGLALSTHQLTFILCLPLAVWLLWSDRWRIWPIVLGAVLGLFSIYPAFVGTPYSLIDTLLFLMAKRFPNMPAETELFRFDLMRAGLPYILLLIPSLIGFPLVGLIPTRFRRIHWLLWTAALFNLLFAISYDVPDRFQFCLPGMAIFAILGTHTWCNWFPLQSSFRHVITLFCVFIPPLAAGTVYGLTIMHVVTLPKHKVSLPFRQDVRYFMLPYLKDNSALQLVTAYEKQVPKGSMVLADRTILEAFLSAQEIGLFKGRILVDIDALACQPDFKATHTVPTRYGLALSVPPVASTSTTYPPPPFPPAFKDTVYIIRYEDRIADWVDLKKAPIGWIGTKKQSS